MDALRLQYLKTKVDRGRMLFTHDGHDLLEEIERLKRELAAARALIRWCYHDGEAMPADYAATIDAARR